MVSPSRWLAEIDDTNWHYVDNAWIVDQLLNRRKNEEHSIDTKGPHYEDQWWIGALSTVCFIALFYFVKGKNKYKPFINIISQGPHTEEHPGEWIWEHANTPVQWFDWAPREPNNYHRQQCLAFLRYTVFGVS